MLTAAKQVIQDWNNHKIPFWSTPPAIHPSMIASSCVSLFLRMQSIRTHRFSQPTMSQQVQNRSAMPQSRRTLRLRSNSKDSSILQTRLLWEASLTWRWKKMTTITRCSTTPWRKRFRSRKIFSRLIQRREILTKPTQHSG